MGAVRRLRGRETHSPDELSDAQFQLLFGLRAGKLLSGGELACVAGLSPATTTQMLDGLEAAGLVVRERSLQDRREGADVADRARPRAGGGAPRPLRPAVAAGARRSSPTTSSPLPAAVMDKLGELFDHLATADPD